jgi:hypothetical protein
MARLVDPFWHRVCVAAVESSPIVKSRFLICLLGASAALTACIGNSGSPSPAPSNVQAVSGDGIAGVTWTSLPDQVYLVFGSTNPALTTTNWLDPGIGGFPLNNYGTKAQPPALVCNAGNGANYFFTVDARTGTAPGGVGSPDVTATPRSAGSKWAAGAGMGATINGTGYATITTCLPTGLPTGIFAAVGLGGAIFTSSDGSNWTQRSPVAADLYGVTAITGSLNNPAAPALLFAAVGAGAAVVKSADGITWTTGVVGNPALPTLRSVTVAGVTFVAVGDGGRIQTSPDGVNWTVRTSGTTANLHNVYCVTQRCFAVGDFGVIDASSDSGASWSPQTIAGGAYALRAVVNGNHDINETGNGVVGIGGVVAIDTWVAVGDSGAVFINNGGGGTWTQVPLPGAPNLTAIGYTSQFVAIDAAGNAYASQSGTVGSWTVTAATGVSDAVGITTSGYGFVVVGTAGDSASSF